MLEYTEHADRGVGARASAAGPDLRATHWKWGSGDVGWRRRRRARVRSARADRDDLVDGTAAARACRWSGRAGRRAGSESAQRSRAGVEDHYATERGGYPPH